MTLRLLFRRGVLLILAAVLVSAAAVIVLAPWRERGADAAFNVSVGRPVLAAKRPRVLFDHGHNNAHSISGRFAPLAGLLRADGFVLRESRLPFTPALLATCDVLVIVNACAPEPRRERPAFTDSEVAAVRECVCSGGSLLLVADHHPYGGAAAVLAQAFAVRMVGGWCDDQAHSLAGTADSGAIAFDRAEEMLGEHPILDGRDAGERVRLVATFTGQSLVAPEGAVPLLKCAEIAVDRVPIAATTASGDVTTTTYQTADSSAAGHCQGLAMPFGSGRVVVLGEAAMLSAQIDAKSHLKFGMNVAGTDNRQFALNLLRWLARGLG